MYFYLILFFLSLVGIVTMIGRELVLVRNGHVAKSEHSHPFVPDLEKIKHLTKKGAKRFGYITLFVTIRSYILFSRFVKDKSKILIRQIKNRFRKNINNLSDEIVEKKEVSKYLRIISEYQQKIRQMKHRIKEEEGIE